MYFLFCHLTLDLSPSRAELHIWQCFSSNHSCLPPRREHLPTSIFADIHWPVFSRSFPSSFSSSSPVCHLFGSSILVHSGHLTQPRQSLSSDDVAQFLLPRSFSDCLVWYFIPACYLPSMLPSLHVTLTKVICIL